MPTEITNTSLYGDANLQGYWRMESDGTDTSSNSYDLTGSGTPTHASGLFGNGVDFELDSSQYYTIADASCANLEITGDQTWSAWVKPETVGIYQQVVAKAFASQANHHFLRINNNNTVRFRLVGLTGTDYKDSTETVTSGAWNHLVGRYDSSNTELSIWVNGVKASVTASGSCGDSNADFAIGCAFTDTADAAQQFVDGMVDDVAIFDRALTDAEIEEIYYTSGPRVVIL